MCFIKKGLQSIYNESENTVNPETIQDTIKVKAQILDDTATKNISIQVMKLLDNGFYNITLDMKIVEEISSTGIGLMLYFSKKLKLKNGMLSLKNLNKTMSNYLNSLMMDQILVIKK